MKTWTSAENSVTCRLLSLSHFPNSEGIKIYGRKTQQFLDEVGNRHRSCGGRRWFWCLVFSSRAGGCPDYQTVTVERGDLTQVVTATGTLNPVTNVTVGSQVSGIITKLYVDFNSLVKKTRSSRKLILRPIRRR
jgi:hypothetical protein